MNNSHKETISIRFISTAFMILAIAIFKPFGLEVGQWQAYLHLLSLFVLGLSSCFITEVVLRYIVRMPRSYERGINYIISRNLRFQLINTPLVALLICLYRHFVMSSLVDSNRLSLSNYLETLAIIAFLSFAIGLYWRFKFRSKYLAMELEETRLLNEELKKMQEPEQSSPNEMEKLSENPCPQELTLTGTTNESVFASCHDETDGGNVEGLSDDRSLPSRLPGQSWSGRADCLTFRLHPVAHQVLSRITPRLAQQYVTSQGYDSARAERCSHRLCRALVVSNTVMVAKNL